MEKIFKYMIFLLFANAIWALGLLPLYSVFDMSHSEYATVFIIGYAAIIISVILAYVAIER